MGDQRLPYRPDLDGIRALAVLAVFGRHLDVQVLGGGWLGVDVFFVLSGYLITRLLLAERQRTGAVSFRRFYARRALRLYPALVLVCLGVIVCSGLYSGVVHSLKVSAVALTYTSDFVEGLHSQTAIDPLGHTWSLAIEEQFYLVWPPVLGWLLIRGRNPLWLAGAVTVAGWVWAGVDAAAPNATGIPDGYWLPWTRFPQLLLGCCVALVLARRPVVAWVGRWWVGAGTGLAAGLLYFDAGRGALIDAFGWAAPVMAILTAVLIVHLEAGTGWARRLLGAGPLAWLGRRSYGFYLFHLPVLFALQRADLSRWPDAAVGLAVTVAATWASYELVELPFLRIKRRFEPTPDGHTTLKLPHLEPPSSAPLPKA